MHSASRSQVRSAWTPYRAARRRRTGRLNHAPSIGSKGPQSRAVFRTIALRRPAERGEGGFALRMSQRRVKRSFEGPPGAADNLLVAVGQAPPQAAEGVKDGVAEERLVFLRGEGAPVPREEVLAEIGPAVPRAVLQPDEIADGRRRLCAFPVNDPQPAAGRVPEPVTRLEIPVAGHSRTPRAERR